MANNQWLTKISPQTTRFDIYSYDVFVKITTIDGIVHDVSRLLTQLNITYSLDDIIPTVHMDFSVPIMTIAYMTQKPWVANIEVYYKQGKGNTKIPNRPIVNFKCIPIFETMKVITSGKDVLKDSRHTYANLSVDLVEINSAKLLTSYVYKVWDIEENKEKNTLEYFICELFKQANQKSKLSFVFHKPDNDRVYEQISVPKTWFLNAIMQIHQNFGLYNSMPIIYSDGESFHVVSLENRVKKRDNPAKCSSKDDMKRHTYEKVSDKKDKAVLIYTSTRDSIKELEEDTVVKGVYRMYTPLTSDSILNDLRLYLPNTIKTIYEYEKYLYEYEDIQLKPLLNIDTNFTSGVNDVLKTNYQDTLWVVENRKDASRVVKGFYQANIFMNSHIHAIIPPPLILEHFKVGFTYLVLFKSEHYEDMTTRFLSRRVVYNFNRLEQITWDVNVEMDLLNADIKDLG